MQLLESERKIRLASILRHSGISLEDISAEAKAIEVEDCTFSINADDLPPAVDLTSEELQVVYYVSGYCAHSAKAILSCHDCISLFLSDCNMPPVENPISFFEFLNRGGLKAPSSPMYLLCCSAYRLFCQLKESKSFSQFLTCKSPAGAFINLVMDYLLESPLISISGVCGHDVMHIWRRLILSFYNTLARNFVRSFSTSSYANSNNRKITKLQSARL
jgi:hypothetical protein